MIGFIILIIKEKHRLILASLRLPSLSSPAAERGKLKHVIVRYEAISMLYRVNS
jgi:hypothetical protein